MGRLVALGGVVVLNDPQPVTVEEPISLMIGNRPAGWVERLPVDLEDAPLALVADEEARFSVPPARGCGDPALAEGEEEDATLVENLGDADLRFRTEAKVLPHPQAVTAFGDGLVGDVA